jgi:hypothetical protein
MRTNRVVWSIQGLLAALFAFALGIQPRLTPLAASGLIVIMTGATCITVLGGQLGGALFPLGVGVLLSVVAYQRTRCTV